MFLKEEQLSGSVTDDLIESGARVGRVTINVLMIEKFLSCPLSRAHAVHLDYFLSLHRFL